MPLENSEKMLRRASSLSRLLASSKKAAPLASLLKKYYSNGSVPTTKLFINGQFVESQTDKWIDIHNPVSIE